MSSSGKENEGGTPFVIKKPSSKRLRQSPYNRRTPRVRELTVDKSESSRVSLRSRALDIQASLLAFKSWKTYKVSPLLNFSYKKEKLRQCESHLSSYIERETKKNIGVLINHETKYKIKISAIDAVYSSQADDKAVSIIVLPNTNNGHQNPLFRGVLVSMERRKDSWENHFEDKMFTVLPLLLASGGQFFVRAVVKYLEAEFSCLVQPMSFSSFQMMWMLAMWAGVKPEVGPKPLFMEYKIPLKNLHTIQYSIAATSVYDIWSEIHDPESNEMDIDEVNAFIASLEEHFKAIFSVDLSNLQLTSIGTAAAAVHKSGVTKILNTGAIPFVLRHLTSLAQEFQVLKH